MLNPLEVLGVASILKDKMSYLVDKNSGLVGKSLDDNVVPVADPVEYGLGFTLEELKDSGFLKQDDDAEEGPLN